MKNKTSPLEIRIHGVGGTVETFIQPDAALADRIFKSVKPARLFTAHKVVIAGTYSLTAFAPARLTRIDDDERWYAFGFDKPSDPSTPEVPENLTATPGAVASGTLFLHCDTARRADGNRFVIKNAAGVKIAEKLSNEPEAVITGLPAGANVTITVSGRNTAGGESAASAPIAAVVP